MSQHAVQQLILATLVTACAVVLLYESMRRFYRWLLKGPIVPPAALDKVEPKQLAEGGACRACGEYDQYIVPNPDDWARALAYCTSCLQKCVLLQCHVRRHVKACPLARRGLKEVM